jgi:hypothetical protein
MRSMEEQIGQAAGGIAAGALLSIIGAVAVFQLSASRHSPEGWGDTML